MWAAGHSSCHPPPARGGSRPTERRLVLERLLDGVQLAVAGAHAGVNSNLLADETLFDPISGNAVLNGIPVDVRRAEPALS